MTRALVAFGMTRSGIRAGAVQRGEKDGLRVQSSGAGVRDHAWGAMLAAKFPPQKEMAQ